MWSVLVFIGHAFFMLIEEPALKLSSLILARPTFVVSVILLKINSLCNRMDTILIMSFPLSYSNI